MSNLIQLPLFKPEHIRMKRIVNPLPRKSVVYAAEQINFSGDGTFILAGTRGVVITGGEWACNVWFDGYPKNHYVLCMWNMLAERVSP